MVWVERRLAYRMLYLSVEGDSPRWLKVLCRRRGFGPGCLRELLPSRWFADLWVGRSICMPATEDLLAPASSLEAAGAP